MIVGILRLRLQFSGGGERDRLLRRICDRLRARFNAGVADVSGDEPRIGTLAASVVGGERAVVEQVLDRMTAEVASVVAGEAMITAREAELQHYNDDEPLAADDYTPMAKGALPGGEFESMVAERPLPRRRRRR